MFPTTLEMVAMERYLLEQDQLPPASLLDLGSALEHMRADASTKQAARKLARRLLSEGWHRAEAAFFWAGAVQELMHAAPARG